MAVSVVAPAALASTFVTSIVGVATFAVLQLSASGSIGPDWSLGVACGLGWLAVWRLPRRLPATHLPETTVRVLLGLLAIGLAVLYAVQAAA